MHELESHFVCHQWFMALVGKCYGRSLFIIVIYTLMSDDLALQKQFHVALSFFLESLFAI